MQKLYNIQENGVDSCLWLKHKVRYYTKIRPTSSEVGLFIFLNIPIHEYT